MNRRKSHARRAKQIAIDWDRAKKRASLLSPGPNRDAAHAEAQRLEERLRDFMERMGRGEAKRK